MRHQTISFIKSGLRIGGYVALLAMPDVTFRYLTTVWAVACALLILSEAVGVFEEIGQA